MANNGTHNIMPSMKQIFAFGSNSHGQLGVGHIKDICYPEKCRAKTQYLSIDPHKLVAGAKFTIIQEKNGSLWLAGENPAPETEKVTTFNNINLATLHTLSPRTSTLVQWQEEQVHMASFRQLKMTASLISANFEAFTIVNAHGQVTTFGHGEKGQLGRGRNITAYTPAADLGFIHIEFPEEVRQRHIVDLSSGIQHTVCLLEGGVLVGWGNGRHGELGQERKTIWNPQVIATIQHPVARVLCGQDFTWVLGPPESGQQSFLADSNSVIIKDSPDPPPPYRDALVNWGSAHLLTTSGQIVSWGRDSHGQLAGMLLTNVSRWAAGSEHLLAGSTPNRIHVWGWGEHGNCGIKVEEATKQAYLGDNLVDTSALLGLPSDAQPPVPIKMGLGAGNGTSFIWACAASQR